MPVPIFESSGLNNNYSVVGTGGYIAEGPDTGGIFNPPANIPTNQLIEHGQSFTIKSQWQASGALQSLMTGCRWRCKILFELMGGGEVGTTYTQIVPVVALPTAQTYNAAITVPPNAIPAGVYHIFMVINLELPSGAPLPVSSFNEYSNVMIYDSI